MRPKVTAIVLAGGSGTRVQAEVNKVYLPLRGCSILEYSLETMDRSPLVSQIVLVVREADIDLAESCIERIRSTPVRIVPGGRTRHHSEMAGVESVRGEIATGETDVVAIHDGARPFTTADLLQEVLRTADLHGGAVPALTLEETLYRVESDGLQLLDPLGLRRVQTPQAFRARPLLEAFEASLQAGFEGVDTAETIERYSELEVRTIDGDPRNIKITFNEDLSMAEELALGWDRGRWAQERR